MCVWSEVGVVKKTCLFFPSLSHLFGARGVSGCVDSPPLSATPNAGARARPGVRGLASVLMWM